MSTRPSWHRLLAPLPPEVRPRRRRVASPELVAAGAAAAIAGWEDLVVELSACEAGLRIAQVLLDANGSVLSASDHVLLREATGGPVQIHQESIGGRFEADGTFNGTHWQVDGPEPVVGTPPDWAMVPPAPTELEVSALRRLVADVVGRAEAAE
jgi:hypothetical protein